MISVLNTSTSSSPLNIRRFKQLSRDPNRVSQLRIPPKQISLQEENSITRTVANDTCLQVDGQSVLQYLTRTPYYFLILDKHGNTLANSL